MNRFSNTFSKWKTLGFCAGALAIVVIGIGCGTTKSSSSNAQMRILHLSPGEPNLDLSIDNKAVSTGIAYGVPTAFVTVTGGNHELKVNQSNTNTNIFDILKEPFASGTFYTYLIVGNAPTPVGQKLVDDHSLPTTSGDFKIRVINASPDSGPVDVYIVTPGGTTGKDCQNSPMPPIKPTISGLASLGASTYQMLPSGLYEIAIAAQGVTDKCLLPSVQQSFSNNQNRTFVMYNAIPNTNGPYTSLTLTDLN